MVEVHRGLQSVRGQTNSKIGEALGMALGEGLGEFTGQYNANKALDSVLNDEELKKKPLSERWQAMQSKLATHGTFGQKALESRFKIEQEEEQRRVQKQKEDFENKKLVQEKQEAAEKITKENEETEAILEAAGFSPEEKKGLVGKISPTSARTLAAKRLEPPAFEKQSDKLMADYQHDSFISLEKAYQAAENENMLLAGQEQLNNTDQLSTPLMVKFLDKIGLPLGVLSNPYTEAHSKLENEYAKNVSDIFPGVIKNFEIETYLKTVPTLANSQEGKALIIKAKKELNKGAAIKYRAGLQILKENGGRIPPDFTSQVYERTKDEMREVSNNFRDAIAGDDIDKFSAKIRMVDENGHFYNIPINKAGEAQQANPSLKIAPKEG